MDQAILEVTTCYRELPLPLQMKMEDVFIDIQSYLNDLFLVGRTMQRIIRRGSTPPELTVSLSQKVVLWLNKAADATLPLVDRLKKMSGGVEKHHKSIYSSCEIITHWLMTLLLSIGSILGVKCVTDTTAPLSIEQFKTQLNLSNENIQACLLHVDKVKQDQVLKDVLGFTEGCDHTITFIQQTLFGAHL